MVNPRVKLSHIRDGAPKNCIAFATQTSATDLQALMGKALKTNEFLQAVSLATVATYYHPTPKTFDGLALALAGFAVRITPSSALLLLCEANSAVELAAYLRADRGPVTNHLNSPEVNININIYISRNS